MRSLVLLLAVVALGAGAGSAQDHHHPIYVVGGGHSPSSPYSYNGVYLLDTTAVTNTIRFLFPTPNALAHNALVMDYDNRSVLMATSGFPVSPTPPASVFQVDPVSMSMITLAEFYNGGTPNNPQVNFIESNCLVDQNADCLFVLTRIEVTSIMRGTSAVLKYERLSGRVSTILTGAQLSPPGSAHLFGLGKDIDTGKVMVTDNRSLTSPSTLHRPVSLLTPENDYDPRAISLWSPGDPANNWFTNAIPQQNHRNGFLQSVEGDLVVQMTPGPPGLCTTLSQLKVSSNPVYSNWGKFDLQTARRPLYWCVARRGPRATGCNWLLGLDTSTWTITTVNVIEGGWGIPNYHFEFNRGRHLQTVRLAPNKWTIRISVPHHPQKQYVIAAGLHGVRPGVPMPDGRRLNLNADAMVLATLHRLIPAVWDAGPGILDKNGEARAGLDVSGLSIPPGGLGVPVWIAVMIMDPSAPSGIAYMPDTYVMRI